MAAGGCNPQAPQPLFNGFARRLPWTNDCKSTVAMSRRLLMKHTFRSFSHQGFTLVEFVVALAVSAILVASTLGFLNRSTAPAKFANTAAEVASAVRRARAEAMARGVATAFLVDTVGKRWWILESATGTVDLTTLNTASLLTSTPALPIITSGSLPAEVTFGPAAGYGSVLPDPFSGVPVAMGTSVNYAYCSFCVSGTNNGFGAITFQPGGQVAFSAGPAGSGQQLTMTGTNPVTTGNRIRLIAIAAQSGVTAVFDK
jgi:prepilin-type N-terminal cleavage/methylation domain-containing protein